MTEEVEVIVIGAGQAGLCVSYFLTQQGRSHLILEQSSQIANAWRSKRWDSFTLVTPNWSVRLPGFPYRGTEPDGFMQRTEIVHHFEQYAASFAAPIAYGKQVVAVDTATKDGQYAVSVADGTSYLTRNVVVATGSYQFPRPNAISRSLPAQIVQMHSSSYRNPSELPFGAVLVVGSADTGCQIAEELHESGRKVYLCVGRARRLPRRYRGKDFMFWVEALGVPDRTIDQLDLPSARYAANAQATGKNGGHTLNLHHLANNGVVLLGRLIGVRENTIHLAPDLKENLALADKASDDFKRDVDAFIVKSGMDAPEPEPDPIDEARFDAGRDPPATLDLKSAGISTVIWANGYSYDYSFVYLPVRDDLGFPVQRRGITRFPGLYFVGMNLLYKRKSGILLGVGEDAEHVTSVIAASV